MFRKIFHKLNETYWRYALFNSHVRIHQQGRFRIGKNVRIINSNIYVGNGGELILEDNVEIEGMDILITDGGKMIVGNDSLLRKERNPYSSEINIAYGKLLIKDHVFLKAWRTWVRFGGDLTIGRYTNVNFGSEIRCDNKVSIGEFCQISYNVRIWDTNTHSILSPDIRRNRTISDFPSFGKESSRPISSPVIIGNDCWLGEGAAILKGTKIGNRVNVGYGTIIVGKEIPSDSTVVNHANLRIFK